MNPTHQNKNVASGEVLWPAPSQSEVAVTAWTETDGVAAIIRAEALEHVLLRMDVERRSFFLTERTKPFPALSGLFQFHVRGHDVEDWDAGLQVG